MYMPSGNHYYLNTPVLNGIQLAFVRTYKYLGTVMTCDNADDANMRRQRGICYARANGILKNFSMCSPVVKATLFRTFCSNMYCSQLWRDFKSCSIRKLIVGYNHSFRYTVVPALGDPRRERPPALYDHVINARPTHFNVKLPLISGHLQCTDIFAWSRGCPFMTGTNVS